MTRYELLDRIGVGGMAEIFRGRALADGGFEKPVAIKRILPKLSQDERFVSMLITEANTLSQLRHRNIVQIFDVGLGSDGQYFLVMEFVDGMDLGALFEALLARGKRLPAHISLHLAAEVCEALHFAHNARGADDQPLHLVHRDVSPSNVLLSRVGEVKLTDFGIAKRTEETTGHGGVRGKFAYISPEQAYNRTVDARSDVFSLGVILFELTTGHRLWSGLSDFAALQAVREGVVPRPRQYDAALPGELEDILMTALAPDPERRFQHAGAFGTALRDYRYSTLTTAGDPAQEIARILAAIRKRPVEEHTREPTVVRISTAVGFTNTGFGPTGMLASADPFDEEETRAVTGGTIQSYLSGGDSVRAMLYDEPTQELQLEQLLEVAPAPDPDLMDAETMMMAARRMTTTARGGATPTSPRQPPLEPARLDRAATPTVREVFYTGAMLDDDRRYQHELKTEAVDLDEPPRRRLLGLAVVAAVVVGIAAFVIAGGLLDDDSAGALRAPDGGGADAMVDGPDGGPTVELPEDEIETDPEPLKKPPAKKKKRPKKKKRKK